MTVLQQPRAPNAPAHASRTAAAEGRYLDALLTDMDRYIKPDLATERAQFLYQAARHVLVRLIAEGAHRPALNETGLHGAPDWSGMPVEDAVQAEGSLLDTEIAWSDARVGQVATAPHTPPVSQEALQSALRHLGYPGATIETMRVIIGGRSKQTILLRATGCANLPADLVMRRDLLVGSLGTSVVNEYGLLRALRTHGVAVPDIYHVESNRDILGTPFLLLQAVSGSALGQITQAPPSRAKMLAAASALASVHLVPVDIAAPLLSHAGAPPTREQMAADITEWQRAWLAQSRTPSPAVLTAFAYLATHVHNVEINPRLVHGDYSFHNILFDGDKLTTVLDWELSHIGHAAEDLGYIKQAVQTVIPWPEFLAAYHAAGGPAIDNAALRFYGLLGTVRLLMKICLARALFEDGKTDDILKADVAAFWMPRIIQKISLEMREILAQKT